MNQDYAIARANQQRNLTKAANTLIGICSGIVADGAINDQEIAYLRTWLKENSESCATWPGNMIAKRIDAILADGVVTDEERSELLQCLSNLTGNHFHETGAASVESAGIPFDDEPGIIFQEMTFCFTGLFYFGTRAKCQSAVKDLLGVPVDRVTSTLDYLVVGSIISPDWANTSYGRKIETAIQRQERYGNPMIVSELQWVAAMEDEA